MENSSNHHLYKIIKEFSFHLMPCQKSPLLTMQHYKYTIHFSFLIGIRQNGIYQTVYLWEANL